MKKYILGFTLLFCSVALAADLTNNTFLTGRNAANTADLSIVRINAADQIEMRTEATSSSDPSAQTKVISIETGASTANRSESGGIHTGYIRMSSGSSKNGASGNVYVESGSSEYQSGDVYVGSGNGDLANDGWSGHTVIRTGGVTGASAECGHVMLSPGQNGDAAAKNGKVKTTALFQLLRADSDPAGAEDGDMYYNTTSNKFRGRANGSWVDLN